MHAVLPYLPDFADILNLIAVLAVALALCGLGRLAAPSLLGEFQLIVGWGLFCSVLTLWGCLTPWRLAGPAWAMMGLGGLGWLGGERRGALASWRVAILSLGIWAVMVPVGPSQVDTWLNLLPNAAYLVDHGMFPRSDRVESYSFIPVAPYNTQFIAYAASLLRGGLVDNAMGSFNILLQCAAGGLLARLLAGPGERIGWAAAAFGLLLAIPLNPGFIPRSFFTGYGEAPIAVAVMAAVWLASDWLTTVEEPRRRDLLVGLAFVLAALVNIKQSAVGMALSAIGGVGPLLLARPDRRERMLALLVTVAPAALLYGVWRWYATHSFIVGELKALPLAQWNISLIPQIFGGVVHAIAQKGIYFLAILAVLAGTVWRVTTPDRGMTTCILILASATIVLDDAFIIFTYIAHFEPSWAIEAHSYFRYMAQLSLLVMIGLTILVQPSARGWLTRQALVTRQWLQRAAVVTILLIPFAAIHYLRFDLEAPQPELARMVRDAKTVLRPDAALALLTPADEGDIAGSYLRGLLLFTPPRLRFPVVVTKYRGDMTTLGALAAAGYRQVLVSCSDRVAGVTGLPPHSMVLLTWSPSGWKPSGAWRYPVGLGERHWAGLLPKASFCGEPS